MESSSGPAPTSPGAISPGIVVDDSACAVDDLAPCGGVQVRVPGQQAWDDLVALAVDSAWPGIEALSYLPGDVADAVRDNATARGQAVADVVASVRTWDRAVDAQRTFAWGDCRFGPATSALQSRLPDGRERYEVLEVTFLFKVGELTLPVHDAGLLQLLGVEPGDRVGLGEVREALAAVAAGATGPGALTSKP